MTSTGLILKGCLAMEKPLSDEVNQSLRSSGIITESEVVLKVGDIYLAYDVVTQVRRKIDSTRIFLSENSKKLLRG